MAGYNDPQAYSDDFAHDRRAHRPSSYHEPHNPAHSHRRYHSVANLPSQQPLNNAIRNAFDKSDAARAVDPSLIAQITAEVRKTVLDEFKHGNPQAPASMYGSIPSQNAHTPPSPGYAEYHDGASEPLLHDPVPGNRSSSRPAPMTRMATADCTPIERMWQPLFDSEGQPTPRLGEFLRGLALCLIEDYEPKNSLVIGPAKMARFYEELKLQEEIYPWQKIFGALPYATLSKIYREMRCQHHLIQEHPYDLPLVPALTPQGFQDWMTTMIQAYPDIEYARLSKAVLDMPISNADNRRERFPKELPQRLFPRTDNLQAQQRCAAALSAEGVGPLRKGPAFPPPPPQAQSSSTMPNMERGPYVSQPDPRAFMPEDDPTLSSVPIERQRQPYSAAPGGGKLYDDDGHRAASVNEHLRRAHSTAPQSPWAPPPDDPYYQPYRAHDGSQPNTRRPRSPSFSSYGTHSDPNVRDIPSSFYAPTIYDSDEETRRFNKERSSHLRNQGSVTVVDGPLNLQSRSSMYEDRSYEPRRY